MCGRFTLTMDPRTFEEAMDTLYDVTYDPSIATLPRYNIAPGQDVLALIHDGEAYRLGTLRWGIPLSPKNKPSKTLVNARGETLHTKPFFKESFQRRRCLILADGYYEWKAQPTGKTPMRIHPKARSLFAMAGIYEPVTEKDGSTTYRFAIVTREADEAIASIHDRMPFILPRSKEETWVHPKHQDQEALLRAVLEEKTDEPLNFYPVDPMVNDPKNDTPDCITPANDQDLNLFDTR
ncbi:MAG: SOS response-associated peptidase [Bacillota bacterium]